MFREENRSFKMSPIFLYENGGGTDYRVNVKHGVALYLEFTCVNLLKIVKIHKISSSKIEKIGFTMHTYVLSLFSIKR
jgi:hypothetical protein